MMLERRAVLAGALFVGAALAVACGEEPPAPEPAIRPVRSETVAVAGGVRERTFSGVAEATTMWKGSFKVPGTIASIRVAVGQSLAAGEIVAQLDSYDYELEVQQAAAALGQAQANARNALATFNRIKELYEDENATRADYDAALASDRSAREAVVLAEKSLELATRRAEYTTLRAPFPGDVAEVPVDENENVAAGTIIVRMTVGDRRQVSVTIPEAYILEVSRGDAATVTFDALAGRRYPGTVDEVGVAAIGTATTFPMTVILDDEAPEVLAGMAADVTFRFGSRTDTPYIAVPLAAVLEDRQGRYVFVLEGGGQDLRTARRTAVTVGGQVGTAEGSDQVRIEIVAGLQEGDRVVTAGAKRIVDGQQVRLESDGS